MNHKQKQKLARRNRTTAEIQNDVPIFQTDFWIERSIKIRERVLQTEQNRQNKNRRS